MDRTPSMRGDAFRQPVDAALAQGTDPNIALPSDEGLASWGPRVRAFVLEDGRRMHTVCDALGGRSAGATPHSLCLIHTAAAPELFQSFLRFQDDIVERAELQHGTPKLHRQLAAWKRETETYTMVGPPHVGSALASAP